MCAGTIPSMLISPVALIKGATGAKSAGIFDYMDPHSIVAKKRYDKEWKEQEQEDRRVRETWNRYYAANNRQTAEETGSPFTTIVDTGSVKKR